MIVRLEAIKCDKNPTIVLIDGKPELPTVENVKHGVGCHIYGVDDKKRRAGWYYITGGVLRRTNSSEDHNPFVRGNVVVSSHNIAVLPKLPKDFIELYCAVGGIDVIETEDKSIFHKGHYTNKCALCGSTFHNTNKMWFVCQECSTTVAEDDKGCAKIVSPKSTFTANDILESIKKCGKSENKVAVLKAIAGVKTMFLCNDCGGVSHTSNVCENPSCPNMPCCGKPKSECTCENDTREAIKAYLENKDNTFYWENVAISDLTLKDKDTYFVKFTSKSVLPTTENTVFVPIKDIEKWRKITK